MKRLVYLLPALLLAGCGGHTDAAHGQATDTDAHDAHGDLIELSDEQAARMGVEVDTIQPGEFADAIRCSGVIERSAADAATATAPAAGIVTLAPGITVGATVGRGALIATVNPSAVSGGDQNRAAKAALDAARREVERLTPLMADRLATAAEYNAAVADYEAAKAAYSPAAGTGRVVAPRAGVITAVAAADGTYVQPGQAVATVAGDNRLTLHAEITGDNAPRLATITDARIGDFTLSRHGGRKEGVSSENGYACIFFSFDNDGSRLPGSGVEVYLLGAARPGVIAVPLGAISEQQGEYYVYLKHSPGHYEKAPVSLGASDGLRVEITSGLKGGEAVVTAGAITVRLAESSGAVPEGHSHSH